MDVSKDIEIACSKDIEQLCSKDMEQAPLKGPVCRFLQKSLIGLDRDKHEKLLRFSSTATSIKLVKALEGLERQGCPFERQGGAIERQGGAIERNCEVDSSSYTSTSNNYIWLPPSRSNCPRMRTALDEVEVCVCVCVCVCVPDEWRRCCGFLLELKAGRRVARH